MGFVLSFTKIMDQQLGRQVCLTTPVAQLSLGIAPKRTTKTQARCQ